MDVKKRRDVGLFSVAGQVVIVTGAARGNGRAIAEGFLSAGAKVVCVDARPEVSELPKRDSNASAFVCDITDFARLEALIQNIVQRHRRIDTLVNNAGVSLASADPYEPGIWLRSFSVNLTAPFHLSGLVARVMRRQKRGSIINITSLGASVGFPDNPSYQASKGGLRQLTRAMARDFGRYNVRINNVCPGYIRTAMTEKSYRNPHLRVMRAERTMLHRWGESSDLVGPCLFLASPASAYITGTDVVVDGGWLANGL